MAVTALPVRDAPLPAGEEVVRRLTGHVLDATPEQFMQGVWWYADARHWLETLQVGTPYSVEQLAAVTAALSPRAPWRTNKLWAKRLVEARLRGDAEPPPVSTTANRCKAWAVLCGVPPEAALGGPKVRAFYRNLIGDTDAVTVDSWTAYAATGRRDGRAPAGREYEDIAGAVRAVAAALRLAPAVVQAIVWVVVRGAWD